MLEFVVLNSLARVILQTTTQDSIIRLSRTPAFAGTPYRVVFGSFQPIDTTEFDAYNGVGAFSAD